jgi:hypothetical protein
MEEAGIGNRSQVSVDADGLLEERSQHFRSVPRTAPDIDVERARGLEEIKYPGHGRKVVEGMEGDFAGVRRINPKLFAWEPEVLLSLPGFDGHALTSALW